MAEDHDTTSPTKVGNGRSIGSIHATSIVGTLLDVFDNLPGWHVEAGSAGDNTWIHIRNAHTRTPKQGWKVHVSANTATAAVVLQSALPILLSEEISFKMVASLDKLSALNQGDFGLSQIGKFITCYPSSDQHAVRIACALHAATRGLQGPPIPSDRVFMPDGVVYYSYGGLCTEYMQTPLGEILPTIITPSGEVVPDRRIPFYQAPEWSADPFVAAGFSPKAAGSDLLVGHRYLVVAPLHESARGAVYLAIDVKESRRCILKSARRGAGIDPSGEDACNRLRYEAEVLAALSPDPRFPTSLDVVEEGEMLYLCMTEIDGETLESHVEKLAGSGKFVSAKDVCVWGREIAGILRDLHERGIVYRDLKSSNIIVSSDNRLCLIDFELCRMLNDTAITRGSGTPGYMSPQQLGGEPVAITDDIYSLGAVLYFIVTGAEPSRSPDRTNLLTRPVRLLNPSIPPALEELIVRCLEPNAQVRFSSTTNVIQALEAIDRDRVIVSQSSEITPPVYKREPYYLLYRNLAKKLGDSLCSAAHWDADGRRATWASTHTMASGTRSHDINTGTAGTLLALSELVAHLDDPTHRATLAAGAHWLSESPRIIGQPLPGLYVGEAGIGTALLRCGQVLKDDALIAQALDRGTLISSLPYVSPDLFNGTAGRIKFHLMLWTALADRKQLQYALEGGQTLIAAAEAAGLGEVQWRIPPGYEGLSGRCNLGYAHGAAGIADALLDLYEASGDETFSGVATSAACWLMRLAVPALDDGNGIAWPIDEGGVPAPAFWCHGAAGIGRFFMHAARLNIVDGAAEIAMRAAHTVARGTRWAGPTQCHGLAGNIEFLLDIARQMGAQRYVDEALSLGQILESFGVYRNGTLVWPSESPRVFTPDYMVGYAGVAVCFLRLMNTCRHPARSAAASEV